VGDGLLLLLPLGARVGLAGFVIAGARVVPSPLQFVGGPSTAGARETPVLGFSMDAGSMVGLRS
jgi:hypothetical protein